MRTYLVTGANRGIGLSLAEAIIQRGDRVVAAVRDPFKLPDLLKTAAKNRCAVVGLDIADARSVARAAAAVDEPIHALINNAGVSGERSGTTAGMDAEAALATFSINALGPLRVAQAFLPHLRRAGDARILNVSTQMASLTGPGHAGRADRMAYRASKAALNKITQGLASDLRADGIPVVAVHPGWVRTDMGGSGADLTPADSAKALLKIADGLTAADSGRFLRWDGSDHPW